MVDRNMLGLGGGRTGGSCARISRSVSRSGYTSGAAVVLVVALVVVVGVAVGSGKVWKKGIGVSPLGISKPRAPSPGAPESNRRENIG
jgi:hypothetical protein